MGLLSKIFSNTRKPEGFFGKMMVNGMNGGGHAQMANWALSSVQIKEDGQILDIGCGGGANIARLLQHAPKGLVQGIDYSSVSVAKSSKVNAKAIAEGRCKVQEASVVKLPFEENTFDGAWCNCSVTNWILKEELSNIIADIKKIVKPHGIIFIGSVLGNFSGWEIDEKYDHLKRYNNHWREDELKKSLAPIGNLINERTLTNTGKKDYLNLVYENEK